MKQKKFKPFFGMFSVPREVLHPGAPRAGMKQKKYKPFSGMFSVPREVPAMTCELLLETLCRLTRCSSCEGVASLSVF